MKYLLYAFLTIAIGSVTTLNAQFGKNKVQYQNFEWKYISSPHFDVYYHQGLQYVAEFCAIKAEIALQSLTANLNFRVTKRISIIVYGSHNEFQQTNVLSEFMPEGVGGVTELFKNRVVLPFEGDWEKFRHVIHHELVHAYLNEMFYNGSLQTALSSKVQIPLWMNEGLAEFQSLGGLDIATDMFMRDITLSEYLPPLSRLGGYFAYRGGQSFYAYIADKYGNGKVGELINRLRSSGDANMAFRTVFGMDMADFSEQWEKDTKKMYFPDLDKFKGVDEFAKRLTNHAKEDNFYNTSPAISPDGTKVAFISDRSGEFAIYLMDIERKGEARQLVSSQRSLNFEELNILTPGISWSPKGDKIAITAKAGGEDALFIVNVEDGDYDKYTYDIKSMTSATWSPDGKYIALVATILEQPDLYLFDVVNKNITKLTNDVFTDKHPAWSPDSRYVYFVSDRGEYLSGKYTKENFKIWEHDITASDIYRIGIATREIERITTDPMNQKSSLALARDGKRMLYVSDNNGIGNLYEMDLESKKIRPKTNSMSGISQVALSQDETKLLFAAQNKGGFDLFMIRNPFEKNLDNETLPLTKFKQKLEGQKNLASQITKIDSTTKTASATSFTGYGNFDIEFSRQQSVEVNKDYATKSAAKDATADAIAGYTFKPQDYKITITNDIILSNAGYNSLSNNAQGVIQMLFSDLMGEHQIYAQANLWYDLKNSNLLLQYAYLPDIVDYSVTGFHNSLLSYLPFQGTSDYYFYSVRNYGLATDASYAFSRFQRVEAGLKWLAATKSNEEELSEPSVTHHFLLPEARYVFDNSQFGFFAPYKGTRLFVNMQLSPLTKRFATFTADIRHYEPIYKQLYGFMFRFSGGASLGPNPRSFFLGGTENWINPGNIAFGTRFLEEPEDYAFLQMPMPLRGFEIAQLRGSKNFITNIEFRFPMLQALVAGPIPIFFDGVLGSIFLDMGTAWNGSLSTIAFRPPIDTLQQVLSDFYARRVYTEGTILMSTGIGLRTLLFGLPLKVDVAWRRDGSSWSEPNWLFSLGADL